MKTEKEIEEILAPWTAEHMAAAQLEGWDLWTTTSDSQAQVQVQRIDDPNEVPAGGFHLGGDAQAMVGARTGTGAHHSAARKIIHDHFPEEWALTEKAIEGSLAGDLPQGRKGAE